MIDGGLLVENLIEYSKENLHLSVYDTDYIRVRLYKFFSLDHSSVKKFIGRGKLLSKDKIVADLKEYICKVFDFSGNIDELLSEIFGQLIPLPSQIDRTFKSLREQMGANSAADYFYSVSDGGYFIDDEVFSPLTATNSKPFGIYFSSADRTGVEHLSFDQRLADNFRAVTYEAENGEYKFDYLRYTDCNGQAELRPSDGKPFVIDNRSIEDALSFLEYMPQFTILSTVCGKTNENIAESERYILVSDDLPVFSARDLSFLSSQSFPDADVSVIDHPVATVRFFTFNRNTVSELISDIVSAWNTYVDEEYGIHGNAKKAGNRSFFSIKILNDGRYMVHISFTKTDDFNLYAEKKGYDELFSSRYYPLALSGRFVIDAKAKDIFDSAVKFVQKKSSDGSVLKPFDKFLAKVEAENLFVNNLSKAQALVGDELSAHVEKFLIAQSAFIDEERWLLNLKKFLSTVGIK